MYGARILDRNVPCPLTQTEVDPEFRTGRQVRVSLFLPMVPKSGLLETSCVELSQVDTLDGVPT